MPPQSKCFIFITKFDNVLIVRDFLFELIAYADITLYTHLIDIKIHKVLVKNDTDRTVKIPKKTRLDILFELDYENVCEKNVFFAEQFLRKPFANNNTN